MGLRKRRGVRYFGTAALVCLSLVIRLLVDRHQHGMPFLTFLPAIVAATYFGGRWCGAFAVGLSAALAARFLFPAQAETVFPWSSTTIALVFFFVWAGGLVWLLGAVLRAYDGMRDAMAARDDLLHTLEQRVADRTAELAAANAQLREEIASRQQAEQKVIHYARLEALGQMVGGISHDFNNMLGIIANNIDLARMRRTRGGTDVGRHLDAAAEGARMGMALTRRLLAFARKQPLQPAVVDVNALMRALIDMLGTTLGDEIDLNVDLADTPWPVAVDPAQFESAILNLAVNARDAMPDGGRLTLATSNARIDDPIAADLPPGDYVLVTVSDTGCGMSDDVLARAFEPFFTTKPAGKGTGLGLSQIHGFIKQSGGHVELASKPREGTVVRLYLPCHAGTMPGMSRETPAEVSL
ncbi:MAG TPA: ATP-binding protein [Asticcacaulis sp.]|nr:ATP-binding protein [Asticcacaulis sp.]